jgi:hypothetical protein
MSDAVWQGIAENSSGKPKIRRVLRPWELTLVGLVMLGPLPSIRITTLLKRFHTAVLRNLTVPARTWKSGYPESERIRRQQKDLWTPVRPDEKWMNKSIKLS